MPIYQPAASDIAWAQNLIRVSKQDARWSIPRSGVIFRIDKEAKQLVQIDGPTSGEAWANEIDANTAVFGAIGYTVIPLRPMSVSAIDRDAAHWTVITGRKHRPN